MTILSLHRPAPLLLITIIMMAFWIAESRASCIYFSQVNAGSVRNSLTTLNMETSLGGISGIGSNNAFINQFGYIPVSRANFNACYLQGGFPLAVQVFPGSSSGSTLVPSAQTQMTLAWTDGTNEIPVQYNVYFGGDPSNLPLLGTQTSLTWPLTGLQYATDYYWRIDTFDQFGRHTPSVATFHFSLSPNPISSMYCAPNPFRAGSQVTRFIFTMSGQGNASVKIYVLPHADLVYSTVLNNLVDGPNLWTYDGRDNHGQVLFNGVYLAVMELNGAQQHGIEKFKFIVAK
jgi:hypothetical protein